MVAQRLPGEDYFAYHQRVGTTQQQGDAARAAARAPSMLPQLIDETIGGGRGVLPGEMDFGRRTMRQPYFPPRQQPMPRGYRNPYAPSPFYQQRFDRYAPMMPQGGGGFQSGPIMGSVMGGDFGGRYGNMSPIFGGGMGQVIPTNIPFRDQGYGSPMLSQNLIQSLSGPNNLMNPYRRDTTLDMLGRFRGGGGGWGGMPNDPYYNRGGYPPVYDALGGGYPPGRGGGGKGGRGSPDDFLNDQDSYDDLTNRPETENGAPPASGGVNSPNSWGSQASNNSYTEDIWTANGTWLVKDAQGNMTRVGSEAEAIAATGGNTDPTTPPVSGEGASSGGGASSDDKLPGEDWFSYWARKDAEKAASEKQETAYNAHLSSIMDRFGYDRDRAEVHHRSTYNQAKEFDANGDGFITPDEYARFKAANTQAAGNGQAASNGQASTNTNNSNPYNYPPAALAALEAAGIDPATLNPADFSQGIGSMAGGGQIGAAQHMRKIPPPIAQRNLPADLARLQARAGNLGRMPRQNLRQILDQLDSRRA